MTDPARPDAHDPYAPPQADVAVAEPARVSRLPRRTSLVRVLGVVLLIWALAQAITVLISFVQSLLYSRWLIDVQFPSRLWFGILILRVLLLGLVGRLGGRLAPDRSLLVGLAAGGTWLMLNVWLLFIAARELGPELFDDPRVWIITFSAVLAPLAITVGVIWPFLFRRAGNAAPPPEAQ